MVKTQEYWMWPESDWRSKDIDWKKANKISAGIDIGTTGSKAVVMVDDQLYAYANIATSCTELKETAEKVLKNALGDSGITLNDIGGIGATDRKSVV